MKKLLIGLLTLGSISAFSSTPTEEVESLCMFHKKFAKLFNPKANLVDRVLGKQPKGGYDGEQQFKNCIDRGLDSYNDGMLAVYNKTCNVSVNKRTSLWGSKASEECRELLLKTSISESKPFSDSVKTCSILSSQVVFNSNVMDYQKRHLKAVTLNNCLKLNLRTVID